MVKAKTKKAAPLRTTDTHPFLLHKPYSDDRIFKKMGEARNVVIDDLKELRSRCSKFDQASSEAISAAISEIELWPEVGGSVDVEVDSHTGVRYRATVVKR